MKNFYIIEESSDKRIWYDIYTSYDKEYCDKFLQALKSRNPYLSYRLVKTTYPLKRR